MSRRTCVPCLSLLLLPVASGVVPGQEGRFVDLRPVPGIAGTPTSVDTGPSVTADALTIVFTSSRPGGLGDRDLFMAERLSPDEPFGEPFNLGAPVNSAGWEHNAHISPDGLVLYFASDGALFMASRERREDAFTDKLSLGSCVASGGFDTGPSATGDGLELLFFSDRAGGKGGFDLWDARRSTTEEDFCDLQNVAAVNTAADEMNCAISDTGLALLFDSPSRSPSEGENDIWIATRPSREEPFGAPVNIDAFGFGSDVNGPMVDYTASLSPDWPAHGSKLYFSRALPGFTGQQLYEATWITDPPEAVISLDPALPLVDQEIVLDGSGSFARAPGVIQSYRWDFGDGQGAEGARPRHAYAAPGRYAITLTVADEEGRIDESEVDLSVVCGGLDVAPWTSADVGAPSFPGSTRVEESGPYLCAGGRGVSSAGDQLHFTYQQVDGDFQVSARLVALEGGNPGAGAGLLLRGGLGDEDPFVGLFAERQTATAPTIVTRVRSRAEVNGSPASKSLSAVPRDGLDVAPLWLRLRRAGDTVSVFVTRSADGSFPDVPDCCDPPLSLAGPVLVGVAAYGRDAGDTSQPFAALRARFSDVVPGPLTARFVRADTNADGALDISDPVATLGYLFLGGPAPSCLDAADADDSGQLDISDAIYSLAFEFLGGPAPTAPFQGCGTDPTDDALGCEGFTPCQ